MLLWATGYFMYLTGSNVNLYAGPGKNYPVSYILTTRSYPVKVIATYDTFRKVIDHENTVGWLHIGQLSQKKKMVMTLRECAIKKKPNNNSKTLAIVEPHCIVEVLKIEDQNCYVKVSADGRSYIKGWANTKNFWGVE